MTRFTFNAGCARIQQQSMLSLCRFEVRANDCKMPIGERLYGLQLDDDSRLHEEIEPMPPDFDAPIDDGNTVLPRDREPDVFEFNDESPFIDRLNESRPQFAMYGNGRPNDFLQ